MGAARLVGQATRLSGRGGGTALPGLLIERGAPKLIPDLAGRLDAGSILVSGTNGKTTTTRILSRAMSLAGYAVVHNRSGSNLVRGIAAALVQANPNGGGPTAGLFEIDEATLPPTAPLLNPRAIVLLNLFRDQLDRYGEVDTIARLWRETLSALPTGCTLVLNADDPLVASLGRDYSGPVLYFGMEDHRHGLVERERAADFVECPQCDVPYDYDFTYYGHLGHYRCPSCGWSRPTPSVRASLVGLDGRAGASLTIEAGTEMLALQVPLPGLYNQYNVLAAAAGLTALSIPLSLLVTALQDIEPAFGRAERFRVDGKDVIMLLIKNPVGANQVIRLLKSLPGRKPVLLALNDLTADGEDVSWIWDADCEGLADQLEWVVVAGRRAEDMALRLKYAGCFSADLQPAVLNDARSALTTALYRMEPGETLYVLPTYTAMLELRQVLSRMGAARPFWELS